MADKKSSLSNKEFERIEKEGKLPDLAPILRVLNEGSPEEQKIARDAAESLVTRLLTIESTSLSKSQSRQLSNLLMRLNPNILAQLARDLKSSNKTHMLRALRLLVLMGEKEKVKNILKKMVYSNDITVRATVVSVFRHLADLSDLSLLLELLKDEDKRVRANVIEVIGLMEDPNMRGPLLRYINDPDNRIRANVLLALFRLGYADILKPLEQMLKSEDPKMRKSGFWLVEAISETDHDYGKFLRRFYELE